MFDRSRMRVGILTYHWVYNFGANLQALTTYSFLSQLGHDVWLLNYRPMALEDLYHERVDPVQAQVHENFCDRYLRQSPKCRSEKDLISFCNEINFDIVIVGSDAMFRLSKELDREDTRFPNPYWLIWANSSLKSQPVTAALSVSAMGSNYFSYPLSVRRGIDKAVRSMSHISVRDRWTQIMLLGVSWGWRRPQLSPDPVVILNEVFDTSAVYSQEPASQARKYILLSVYDGMLSQSWIEEFVHYVHKEGLQVYSLPLPESEVNAAVDQVITLPLSPLSWYEWIRHAAGFVGVRMHPVLCAMANRVPFLSFDDYQKGRFRFSSKTYDLCTRAKIRDLCVSSQQRQNLKPEIALQLLKTKEQGYATRYIHQARRSFRQSVEKLLMR